MNNLETLFMELRPSQARHRGFESHHPLHFQKDVSSNLDASLEQLLLSVSIHLFLKTTL